MGCVSHFFFFCLFRLLLTQPLVNTMGGGNAQKSATARAKNAEKAAQAAKGGGGAAGVAKRNAIPAHVCSVCKQSFPSKQKKGAEQHVESKHAKSDFATCFPTWE